MYTMEKYLDPLHQRKDFSNPRFYLNIDNDVKQTANIVQED